jgi:hypothetical protein
MSDVSDLSPEAAEAILDLLAWPVTEQPGDQKGTSDE